MKSVYRRIEFDKKGSVDCSHTVYFIQFVVACLQY